MFQQHEENLEGLLLQTDAALALAQLTGANIKFKLPEANFLSRRAAHGVPPPLGASYSITAQYRRLQRGPLLRTEMCTFTSILGGCAVIPMD
ncbi:MAG: hypothetical protein DMG22_22235 [Acidobacteria bacterium]|nr:MAG: hypothetical protein DMG22_22235 [Acidobacteriota bacterium]